MRAHCVLLGPLLREYDAHPSDKILQVLHVSLSALPSCAGDSL